MSPYIVIEYIKSSIDILVDLRVSEKVQEIEESAKERYLNPETNINEYEKLLRKLESDTRMFIKVSSYLILD